MLHASDSVRDCRKGDWDMVYATEISEYETAAEKIFYDVSGSD